MKATSPPRTKTRKTPPPSTSVAALLAALPPHVRAIVRRARRVVRAAAAPVDEVAYRGGPPRSRSAMWKLVRFRSNGVNVVALGAFAEHASIFFFRGRELDDGSGLLQGTGKALRYVTLRSVADAGEASLARVVRRAFRLQRARTTALPRATRRV